AESINQQGGPASQQLLKDALALMDETSILTIHGFCQKTLQEFAFETNQVFGAEALSPEEQDEMSASRIHHYWRKYIAPLGNNLLKQINPHLKIDVLEDMLKQALSGKQFNLPITPRTPLLDSAHQQELLRIKGPPGSRPGQYPRYRTTNLAKSISYKMDASGIKAKVGYRDRNGPTGNPADYSQWLADRGRKSIPDTAMSLSPLKTQSGYLLQWNYDTEGYV
ncbi:hypothetical protein EBT25_11100, partial [bacterium]|nr:hypothetical protein [bacterium]